MNIFKNSPWENPEENIFTKKRKKPPQDYFGNFNFNNVPVYSIILLLFAIWECSGIYKVEEGSQAAVLSFGKFTRTTNAGLNYHLPIPIESVITEKVDEVRRTEIGYRSTANLRSGFNNNRKSSNNYRYLPEESTMLTGDENIIVLNCDIMWHVKDLSDFLFNVENPELAVKSIAESAIREVIGKTPISNVLSNEKQEVASQIEKLTQETLDLYKAGIQITEVQLLKAEPPETVIDAYRDVQTSRADKERSINEAYSYKNDILPRARGEAAKLLQDAEAY